MAKQQPTTERQRDQRGSQQLHRRRDGTYAARVTQIVDGEKIRQMVSLETSNLLAARAKLRRIQAGELAIERAAEADTVSDFAKAWFDGREARGIVSAKKERATFDAYWQEAIGPLPLPAVGSSHILSVLEELGKGHRLGKRGGRLGCKSISAIRTVAHQLFASAKMAELVKDNPVSPRAALCRGARRR